MEKPNLNFEKNLWKKGFGVVAGADEVGRGSFAGPVVASAVAFASKTFFRLPIINEEGKEVVINDSKKLSAKQREVANEWIKKNTLCWGIGQASVAEINRFGIAKATKKAFRASIYSLNSKLKTIDHEPINYLLIDAFYIQYVRGLRRKNQLAIIDGDEKSVSIAAASIIAKVYRDKVMVSLGKKFKKYGWIRNKGYGTREHRHAILKYGITKNHRKVFVETFVNNSASSPTQSKT